MGVDEWGPARSPAAHMAGPSWQVQEGQWSADLGLGPPEKAAGRELSKRLEHSSLCPQWILEEHWPSIRGGLSLFPQAHTRPALPGQRGAEGSLGSPEYFPSAE